MNIEERIVRACEELETLSEELQEKLDTLNYHSISEAVRDLDRAPFRIAERMRYNVVTLLRTLGANGYLEPGRSNAEVVEDIESMQGLLDGVLRLSAEPKSYQYFLEGLPALLELLDKWVMEGLKPVPSLSYHEG